MDIFGYKLDTVTLITLKELRSNNARMSLNINKKPRKNLSVKDIYLNDDKTIFMRNRISLLKLFDSSFLSIWICMVV